MTHDYPLTRFYLTVTLVVVVAVTLGRLALLSAIFVFLICCTAGLVCCTNHLRGRR